VRADDPGYLRRLTDSMRGGLVAIDDSGMVRVLNASAARLLGCGEADVLGKPCREVLAGQPLVHRLLESALDGRTRPGRAELVLRPVAGGPGRTIGFTLETVRDEHGAPCGAALLFRDLTPFERQSEQERLRDRLAAVGEMAAGLAHELRNPLAGLEVLAGLLRRRLEGLPEELALLEELQGEIATLERTVSESLEFVRPVPLRRRPSDPVELLEESLALARSRVPFHGSVERRYDEELPWPLLDAEQVRAGVTNLTVNAFEAMAARPREGGHVLRLGLAVGPANGDPAGGARPGCPASRALQVTVADTGPGIDPELRERVFHPFFSTKPGGSGVGLAHAQKVMAAHGGHLGLAARDDGAEFELVLPLEGEPA